MKINKDHLIPVRVTEEEKQKITEKAKKAGLSPSTYLRMLGLRNETGN